MSVIVAAVLGIGGWLTLGNGHIRPAAPDATYTLLDGNRWTTAQLRGKVVLVNFWATDCAPCIEEMPQLVATHQKYKSRGFETVAVSMRYNPPAYVIRYAEDHDLPFGVAIDNTGEIARQFGNVEATPTSVLIDKHGQVVKRYLGEPDFAALHALIEKLLAEG